MGDDRWPLSRWRRRPLAGALGLRAALAEHTPEEAAEIARWAAGARSPVELGVSEGASAVLLADVMDPDATITLVDPYWPGRLRFSAARIVARRLLRGRRVRWVRATSAEAAVGWTTPIDVLLIDAIHTEAGVREDFAAWSPHVEVSGRVIFRRDAGAIADELVRLDDWVLEGEAATFGCLRRRGATAS